MKQHPYENAEFWDEHWDKKPQPMIGSVLTLAAAFYTFLAIGALIFWIW